MDRMTNPQELCERLSRAMSMYGPNRAFLEELKAFIEAQAKRIEELEHERDELIADNRSIHDSLTKEAVARCEAEDRIASLEAQLRKRGEPVAWMLQVPDESRRWYTSGKQAMEHWVKEGAIATPLYAHPPAAAASDIRRYDWTTTGMKQSPDGAWAMASDVELASQKEKQG